ncbi:protein-tyrosine phosphatase [Breznakia sp. PF5-3]|uniref:tyrosine-protein phosphatase n=1 Tax=unclassified Breznakia TaxID=2623764 RepID=UPI00240623DD|nr:MULTISPECIES: tyrosine-protein phosphatase [unclassified Breznakia]MDF9825047.1 protein-tyrosine phosphatase [Breznakia sp. PM6-1]MDF9835894.1 protein-tyrosine phosphatase [Breznakia sp. PF5-3]MDF9837355.1 protein-tyrosine phosphatase [Breznakia sp. PFB2-8]MDF9859290.1 protein-tyrosine phosphatase [Breznakia sp. PH5-24]
MKNLVRLPLENAKNVRELGGYPIRDNQSTKWHCFLRSDDISALSDYDVKYLKAYGLTSILDLRSDKEIKERPDTLMGDKDIVHKHVPFMIQGIGDVSEVDSVEVDFTMGSFYLGLLKHKEQVKTIMKTIADMPDGVMLFHCAAGKDRTGVVAMLLLGLVGVDRQDIITNYEQTFTNLRYKKGSHLFDEIEKDQMHFMYSLPEYMEPSLDYIEKTYGNVEQYLLSCNIEQQVLQKIKDRFIDQG